MSRPTLVMFRPLRRYALVACIALWCTACVLTHLPPDEVPNFHTSDASLHTVGFAGLTASFFAVLLCFGLPRLKRTVLIAAVMPAYAALDEWTQPLFRRTCDLMDWAHDVMGTAIGIILMEAFLILVWTIMARAHRKNPPGPIS